MQPSAPKSAPWGSHGPKEVAGVPGSDCPTGEQLCCSQPLSLWAPCPLWLSRQVQAGHSLYPWGQGLCDDPESGRAAGSSAPLTYLRREAGPLSCSRSAKRGMGDRMPHSSSTWNCAGARALPDSSSSLPMVNCRDDSPDSKSRGRQPLPQSLAPRSFPCPHLLEWATLTSPTCPIPWDWPY